LKNRVLIIALLFGDKDINIIISITLYKAFISNYPDFNKLQVFKCKAILYKIEVEYPTTFKPYIKDVKTLIVAKIINAYFNKYTFP
jgi:hypothetical protein